MTLCIMEPDVFELRRVPESRNIPIQIPQPGMNSRKPGSDITEITLEVLDVDGVEANNSREESDVCFRDSVSEIELLALFLGRGEMGLDLVQRGEERGYGVLVRGLRRREPGSVYPVVDVGVGPLVGRLDVSPERGGKEIDRFVRLGEEVVEGVVEHADDFGTLHHLVCWPRQTSRRGRYLVAHDRLRLLIVQGRNGEPPLVLRVD